MNSRLRNYTLQHGVVLLLALGSACGGAGMDAEGDGSDAFRITLERGGGFTGLYTGYDLHSGGRIERWEQLPGGVVEVEWSDSVAAARVRALGRRLREAGADWQSEREGNMTSRVILVVGDSTSTWAWEGTGDPPAPRAFADWYRDTRELCRSVGERRGEAER